MWAGERTYAARRRGLALALAFIALACMAGADRAQDRRSCVDRVARHADAPAPALSHAVQDLAQAVTALGHAVRDLAQAVARVAGGRDP